AERAFGQIATTGRHTEVPSVAEAVDQALERVRKLRANGCGLGLTSGLFDFDQAMGGLHPGELVVLAARPRVGKTDLETQISLHNAEHGRRVLFVSLEMGGDELAIRTLCGMAGVDGSRVRTGRLDDRDVERLEFAGERLARSSLHILD